MGWLGLSVDAGWLSHCRVQLGLPFHELALLSLQKFPQQTKVPCQQVEFCAYDQADNHVIIQAWLLQFRNKKIQVQKLQNHSITIEDSCTVTITACKDEWERQTAAWLDLTKKPAKMILNIVDVSSEDIFELWGRSWRKGNKKVASLQATSFRRWIKIKQRRQDELLKKSGITFRWFTLTLNKTRPLSQDSSKATSLLFRIIWLDKETTVPEAIGSGKEEWGLWLAGEEC